MEKRLHSSVEMHNAKNTLSPPFLTLKQYRCVRFCSACVGLAFSNIFILDVWPDVIFHFSLLFFNEKSQIVRVELLSLTC